MMKLLPREQLDLLLNQCSSDLYYKTFFSWYRLIEMLFGIFSRCYSMGEVCDSMRALESKPNYRNMDCVPAKSTAGNALPDRSDEVFKLFYFALIAYFRSLLSVSEAKMHDKKLLAHLNPAKGRKYKFISNNRKITRRSGFDIQIPLDDRIDLQETETKLYSLSVYYSMYS